MTAKKNQGKGGKPLNKTSFIKSFADGVSADEIVARAKDVGLDLSKKLIWTVQSEVRHSGKNGASKVTKAPPKVKPVSKIKPVKKPPAKALRAAAFPKSAAAKKSGTGARRPMTTVSSSAAGARSSAEQKMTAILIELGTARADELYRSVRSKLHALAN